MGRSGWLDQADSGLGWCSGGRESWLPGWQTKQLAQVESGGGHTQLEVDSEQAGGFGVTSAEEVGQVEDEAFDEGALLHFLFEQVGFVVFDGGQDKGTMVADEDLAMSVGLTIGRAAMGPGGVLLELLEAKPERAVFAHEVGEAELVPISAGFEIDFGGSDAIGAGQAETVFG